MYLNEISYVNNQNTQYRDARKFLTEKVSRLGWETEKGVVMDLGCGPGKTTFELILPFFPNLTKLVAVDLLPNMIDFAKKNHSHPKIEYEVANIEDRDTVKRWYGDISKLVSIHCIHWLENQKLGFQNIYDVLKQGGEAAFCFSLKSPIWDLIQSTGEDQKWSTYLKGVNLHIPESQNRENNIIYYKKMLEEIGFSVIFYEEISVKKEFPSDQKCKEYIASLCILLPSIPVEFREDFTNHLFQQYLSVVCKSGALQHTGIVVWLVIKK